MNANCRYLDAILEQYHQGRDNRLAYRIARRDAHNTDAELASVVSNMSTEPRATAEIRETAFRLLCLNHTFTSYISTLGAHREKLTNPDILALLDDAVCYVDDALHHQPADEPRVHQALDELVQRIAHLDPAPTTKLHWSFSKLACLSLCCRKFVGCDSRSLPGGMMALRLRQRIKPLRKLPANIRRECRFM